MKRPAFQFYPADWRKDSNLQSCSIAARGLWVEILCVMHECDRYGFLVVNDKPMRTSQIARLVGLTEKECAKLLSELEDAGVFSRLEDSTIYSRRMVKDERLRVIRGEAGRLGGNPALSEKKDKVLVKQKVIQLVKEEGYPDDNQSPTPSSSSSTTVKTKTKAIIACSDVFPEILDRGLVEDWYAIRKAKALPVTKTAVDGILREAEKAGLTIEQVIRICGEKGWASFSAKWLDRELFPTVSRPQAQREEAWL